MLSAAHTWSLTAIAIVSVSAMLWSFQAILQAEQVALAKRKVWAHLYAFRLYADEPALIFRAQKQLLTGTRGIWRSCCGLPYVVLVPVTLLLFGPGRNV